MNIDTVPPLLGTTLQLNSCFAGILDWTRVVTLNHGNNDIESCRISSYGGEVALVILENLISYSVKLRRQNLEAF